MLSHAIRSVMSLLFSVLLFLAASVSDTTLIQVSTEGDDVSCKLNDVPCKTIARGIELAGRDGTVLVGPGTYAGDGNRNVEITQPLTLMSLKGAAKTIVDCESKSRCLIVSANATVQGFTFKNGIGGHIQNCTTHIRRVQPQTNHKDQFELFPEVGPSRGGGVSPQISFHGPVLALIRPEMNVGSSMPFRDAGTALDHAVDAMAEEDFDALMAAAQRRQSRDRGRQGEKKLAQRKWRRTVAPSTSSTTVQFGSSERQHLRLANVPNTPQSQQRKENGAHGSAWEHFRVPKTAPEERRLLSDADLLTTAGGCILVQGGATMVHFEQMTVMGGVAQYGGGLALNGTRAVLVNVSISRNRAQWGGGLLAVGGSISMEDSVISENAVVSRGIVGSWPMNFAVGGGMALFEMEFAHLSSCSIVANQGVACGDCDGTLCPAGVGGGLSVSSEWFSMLSSQVLLNTLTSPASSADLQGGGIWSETRTMLLTETYVSQNSVTSDFAFGGGIYSSNRGSVSLTSSRVTLNTVTGSVNAYGGGMFISGKRLLILSSNISANTGVGVGADGPQVTGGGLYAYFVNVSIASSQFTDNEARSLGRGSQCVGGGVYTLICSLSMTSTSVNKNSISCDFQAFGGGLYSDFKSQLSISKSEVSRNAARSDVAMGYSQGGGTWACCGSSLHFEDSRIQANILEGSQVQGGALWLANDASALSMVNVKMISNVINGSQLAQGGALYAVSVRRQPAAINLVSCRLDMNAIILTQQALEQLGGGGICLVAADFNMERTTVSNNRALGGLGGGLLVMGLNATVRLMQSEVSSNSAVNGGGMYLASTAHFNDSDLVRNVATEQGGGIFLSSGSALYFHGTAFRNVAALGGTLFSAQRQTVRSELALSGTLLAAAGQAMLVPIALTAAVDITNATFICDAGSVPEVIRHASRRVTPIIVAASNNAAGLNVTQATEEVTTLTLRCRLCPVGKYLLLPLSLANLSNASCLPCPYGGNCGEGGSVLNASQGFWGYRTEASEVAFTACPEGYCCGNSACPFSACAAGRVGTLCGECPTGSTNVFYSPRCVSNSECNDAAWAIPLWVLSGVFYAATCIVPPFKTGSGLYSVVLFFYQVLAQVRNEADWDATQSVIMYTVDTVFTLGPITTGHPGAQGVCIMPLDMVQITASNYALPALVSFFMAVWWANLQWLWPKCGPKHSVDAKGVAEQPAPSTRAQWVEKWTPTPTSAIRLLQLSYSSLTSASFALLTCRFLHGANRSVLFRQGSIECPQPWQLGPFFVLLLLTICPWALMQWARRYKDTQKDAVESFSQPFLPGSRHWLAVMLYQRWCLSMMFALVSSPVWRGLLFNVALVFYLLVGVWHRPFRLPSVQKIYVLSLSMLVLISTISLIGAVRSSLASTHAYDDNRVIDTGHTLAWCQFLLAVVPGATALALLFVTEAWPFLKSRWQQRRGRTLKPTDVELQLA